MASTFNATQVSDSYPAPDSCSGGEVKTVRGSYSLGGTGLVVNDVINMVKLPAYHVPVDLILDVDQLDSSTSAEVDVGIEAGDTQLVDVDAFIDGETSTIRAAAGGVVRASSKAGFRISPDKAERNVTVTVITAPKTAATTATIGVTLLYRAQHYGA
jgi:hypothetical protein